MIIGIDIDGVLTDMFGYVYKASKKYNKENNIKGEKIKSSLNFNEHFGWSDEQCDKFWDECIWEYSKNVKFYKSASKYIKKLKNDGHEIYIVTKRHFLSDDDEDGTRMKALLSSQLSKYDIYYDKIFAVNRQTTKVTPLIDNKVDIMIDDEVKNIEEISKHIPTICYTTKYNKAYSNQNMYRCKNWRAIYNLISNLSSKAA